MNSTCWHSIQTILFSTLFFMSSFSYSQTSLETSQIHQRQRSPFTQLVKNNLPATNTSFLLAQKQDSSSSSPRTENNTIQDSQLFKLPLFTFIKNSYYTISFDWAQPTITELSNTPPAITDSLFQSTLPKNAFFLNIQKNIFQFPYIIQWGIKGTVGYAQYFESEITESTTTIAEDTYFLPFSLSGILSLQLIPHQMIIPFVSAGHARWGVHFNDNLSFQKIFEWSVGTKISLSLLKPSFKYTLMDEYGLHSIGVILEKKYYYKQESIFSFGDYFMSSFNIGIYIHL